MSALDADRGEIAAFTNAMFVHADEDTFVSLRTFTHNAADPPVDIKAVRLNGTAGLAKLSQVAFGRASYAARYPEPTVFCPPVATFTNAAHAREVDLANGLALSVEIDVDPAAGHRLLRGLIGVPTVVVKSGGLWVDPASRATEAKLHAHWRLMTPTRSAEDHARLKRARRLATALIGGDHTNIPIVHPIRWPGSVHRKGEPKLARTVGLVEAAEIDLDEALEALEEAAAARGINLDATGPGGGNGDGRDTADLIAEILSGKAYVAPLTALSARYAGGGMTRLKIVETLEGLMLAVPLEARDGGQAGRWQSRFDGIPRMAESAVKKFGPDPAATEHGRKVAEEIAASAKAKAGPQPGPSAGATGEGGTVGGWPDPGKLPSGLPPVEPFDPVMLPARLRPWVEDIATRMQAPLDYAAAGAMACFGAAVGRRIAIRPKEQDDWTVVANLWAAIIGRPAMMKSPILKEIMRPLTHLEMIARAQHKKAMKDHGDQQRLAKAQKKIDDENITKALRKGQKAAAESILRNALQETDPPTRRRYIVNNTTMEAMGVVLAANPGGVLLHRDELVGFFRSMDREGRQEDRPFYLEAWAGDSRYSHDRIDRGFLDIEACCVSLLGGIQPGPLTSYLQAMVRGGEGDDGLIQRLQLMVWPDVSKAWRNVDRVPDLKVRQDVVKLFEDVEDIIAKARTTTPTSEEMEPGQLKAEEEDQKRPRAPIPYLRFDRVAQQAFNAWREKLEHRLRDDSLHPALEAHLAKYRSLLPSLALLFHIADAAPGTELGPVGVEAWDAAEAWADYLESHARRVYDSVIRSDMFAARELGLHIRNGDLISPFSLRDVYRPCWAGLDGLEAAEAAVEILIGLHWLLPGGAPTRGSQGGRPSPKYYINPKVLGAST